MTRLLHTVRSILGRPVVSLRIRAGEAEGRVTPVFGGRFVIGRGPASDLQLSDDDVSRRHAMIVCEHEGGAKIVDLQSRNGTFVNGRRVLVQLLANGDQVRLGESVELEIS